MKAIILAAGRGSRMKTLTEERPKCLIELHGQTLLAWQLNALRGAGIEQIAIVTGYKRELLANQGMVEFYNPRWNETNMVSSLEYAEPWLESEPCIVSYSDIFYSATAVKSLIDSNAALAVTYDPNWLELWSRRFSDPLSDAETFRTNSEGNLIAIGNRPIKIDEIQGQYMGLLRFTPQGWIEVKNIRSNLKPELRNKMHMTAALQMVIDARRITVSAIPYEGYWGEIDSPADLKAYAEIANRVG
jgi:choline kinase